jgi:mitochondrial fission protein ELM1
VADQNAGANGVLLDLFGRPASTAIGPYRIAQKSGSWVLPAFIHRVKGPYHEVALGEPMVIKKDEDVVSYMKKYNQLLEEHVRAHPDHWFWMHKKWKITPVKRILVLDDGKKGHLKQSLAVVKQIKRYRQEEGFSPENTPVDIVEVTFKNKLAKAFLNLLSPFLNTAFNFHLKCLKVALDKKSYERAINRYADVIISCGSSLFGINRILKIENYARSLTILDPGSHVRGKFDLVVKPKHDVKAKESKSENIIITDLAPNLIEPDELKPFSNEIEQDFGSREGIKIGLLIGGDNPHFHFSENLMRAVSNSVKEACEELGGHTLVTTSRRTSNLAERTVSSILSGYSNCLKFVSGKNDRDEHTVEKILAASDIVIVSGESISMVSEAVSSGKPVLVFMPDKKTSRFTKYEKFVKDLEQMKYLKIVEAEQIRKEVGLIATEGKEHALPDDDRRIREKMYKLF